MSQEYKIFVGGLTVQTTELDLEDYFSSIGPVSQIAVIRNKQTGLSRCYAFIHTSDSRTYQRILSKKHFIHGRMIDCKDGFNKDDNPELFAKLNSKKIFVGGLSPNTQDRHLSDYFSQFGRVFKAYVIVDPRTQKSKRFGFIIMEDEKAVESVLAVDNHAVNGHPINCKRFDRNQIGNIDKLCESGQSPSHDISSSMKADEGSKLFPTAGDYLSRPSELIGSKLRKLYFIFSTKAQEETNHLDKNILSDQLTYLPENYKNISRPIRDESAPYKFNLCLSSYFYSQLERNRSRLRTTTRTFKSIISSQPTAL